MKTAKKAALDVIGALPNDTTLEDIQYHLYVRGKVEKGLIQAREGRVVEHEEVVRKMRRWTER